MVSDAQHLRAYVLHARLNRRIIIREKLLSSDNDQGKQESEQGSHGGKHHPCGGGLRHIGTRFMRQENREYDQHHDAAHVHHDLYCSYEFVIEVEVQSGNADQAEKEVNGRAEDFTGSNGQQGASQYYGRYDVKYNY